MNSKSPNTKLLPCMYYLKNSCTSDRCTFSHNYEIPSNDFCKYHFRGTCTYGKKCRLIHLKPKDIISTNQKDILVKYDLPPFTKPSTSAIEYSRIPHKSPSKTMHKDIPISFDQAVSINNYELSLRRQQKVLENKQICKFNMVNDCPYQDKDCVDLHNGIICQYCGLKKVHPHSKSKAAAHLKVCKDIIESDILSTFDFEESKELICEICMITIFEKKKNSEKRFGLMQSCDHIFCLGCIRQWRNEFSANRKNRRKCPICRISSNFVVPSEHFKTHGEEKDEIFENYISALSVIDCKLFKFGKGTCQYGTSCLYRHADKHGNILTRYIYTTKPTNTAEKIEDVWKN